MHRVPDYELKVRVSFLGYVVLTDCHCINVYKTHTGKCIRRFAGIYAYCQYFIGREW